MKYIKILIISTIVFLSARTMSTIDSSINDGILYFLDLSDPSLYKTTCYDKISSKWRVKNDVCTLETRNIKIPGEKAEVLLDVPVSINIKSSGNLTNRDFVVFQYFYKNRWKNIDSICGENISNKNNILTYLIKGIDSGELIKLRLIFNSSSENKEIILKCNSKKDFCVGSPYVSGTIQSYIWNRTPLVIESFDAEKTPDNIILKWTSSYEFNNKIFILEKSSNGIDFEHLTKIEGKKYSNDAVDYNFIISNNTDKVIYFKLKQQNYKGVISDICLYTLYNFNDTNAISINNSPCIGKCTIYLQPKFNSSENKVYYFNTFDALGNLTNIELFKKNNNNNFQIVFDEENYFKPGVILIKSNSFNKIL